MTTDGEGQTGDGNETVIKQAVAAFSAGKPVCLFDSDLREGETDLLFPGISAQPETMRQLRFDCGGLLFLAIGHDVGELYGFPWLQDLYSVACLVEENPILGALITDDLQYDNRSAFTLSLNHRETFTGITDRDRALTTRRFAELFEEIVAEIGMKGDAWTLEQSEIARTRLGQEFRTPGHIPVCREAPGGFKKRQGHTELAVGLARLAGTTPVVIGAEMLQSDGDGALPVAEAIIWASERGIPFLTGAELVEALNKV